jgi:hypothetical protein
MRGVDGNYDRVPSVYVEHDTGLGAFLKRGGKPHYLPHPYPNPYPTLRVKVEPSSTR